MQMRWAVIWSLFLLFGIVAVVAGSSRTVATGELLWSPDRPIEWSDFQGRPPEYAETIPQAAEIHTTIRWHLELIMEYDCEHYLWKAVVYGDSLVVTNTMNPSLSWVAPGKQSNAILDHEQGHFDLNEVYRRKLQVVLSNQVAEGDTAEGAKEALQAQINKTAEEILGQLAKTQEHYDEETHHGTELPGQEAWDQAIDAWLANPSQVP